MRPWEKRWLRPFAEVLRFTWMNSPSVLICAGRVADLESAASLTHDVREQLDGLSERPIGEILEAYRSIIDRWVADLH
jgi:hypothetical protein